MIALELGEKNAIFKEKWPSQIFLVLNSEVETA